MNVKDFLVMGKAERNRGQSARERIAAQQAAARQAEARRRMLLAGGGVLVVVVIVLAIVLVKVLSKPAASHPSAAGSNTLPAGVQTNIATVPAATLTAVGQGSALPAAIKPVTGPALTSGSKPEVLYIGAEWCPYCAAMRWSMATALSRFGTFSPLSGVHSSSSDVYPNTATLTFYKSTFTSKYLAFAPVENQDVNHNLLQSPTATQQALWTKYAPPGNGYPFIDIGNRYIFGVSYNPQVLQGLSWSQIASALHDPSSAVAKGAVGSANLFTAAICKVTGNTPASVCTASPVAALEGHL
jgi:thiol-disulfide isomerase/thioredoxin